MLTNITETSQSHRKIFEYIIELGIRLKAKSETISNVSIFFFKIIKNGIPSELCPYTLATSCFLLAGKVTNDPVISVRDVMNISYCVLHPSKPPLEIGEIAYSLRESLLEMELVILRFLRFRLNFKHPHQHVILMLAILRDWYPNIFEKNPNIDSVAAMFLQDLYVQPQIILDHKPKTIAVLIISMTFSALKIKIDDNCWVPTLQPNFKKSRLCRLKRFIMKELYKN